MKIVNCESLALKKVKIKGNVIGKFGTFEIEQIFKNETNEVLEVGYTFPIIETATIIGFEVQIGEQKLKGVCKEKKEAQKIYEKNIVRGNSAYKMEEETNNVFKIAIGKLDKDEEVRVCIKYIDKFEIVDNEIKLIIPTLVTPKYKSNVTNKLVYGDVKYTVDFNITIDKKLNIQSLDSPSHQLKIVSKLGEKEIIIEDCDLSKDCIINFQLKNELSSNAMHSKTLDNNEIVYLSFMPEILDTYEDEEKEYLFLIDVSGSMEGIKLNETKRAVIKCLEQLDVGDKFNIIAFESTYKSMNVESIEYNEENLLKAIKYVKSLRALGGTEIFEPIKFSLYEKDSNKIILLFTDGQVGNEQEIVRYVENNINKSRIFPFGIDTNVNAYFIKQIAKVGNGKAELIHPNEKIDEKIIRTFSRIQTPLLEDIKLDYGKNELIDEIKEENSLFNYEFYNVFAKIKKLKDDIELKGKIRDKEYSWKLSKDEISESNTNLEILFANLEIERLEQYIRNAKTLEKIKIYEDMIIELSEKYNINSKYTSFVTVYERKNKIFEIPTYQETILSNKTLKSQFENFIGQRFLACSDEYDADCIAAPNLDIPCFLRRNKSKQPKETNQDILKRKIKEYYNYFINQKEKSILTYILFALYCLKSEEIDFKYELLLKFLNEKKELLQQEELSMKLLCLCYQQLPSYMVTNKKETLGLLKEPYRKIAYTNMRLNVNIEKISKSKLNEIIKEDKIIENINAVIWFLYGEE